MSYYIKNCDDSLTILIEIDQNDVLQECVDVER